MADLVRVDVDGDEQLRATSRRAAAQLDDLATTDAAAAQIAATRARAIVPKVSGALAATIRAGTGGEVTAGNAVIRYAGVIHSGWPARNIAAQPYLTQALAVTEDQVVRLYADKTDRTIHDIKGK